MKKTLKELIQDYKMSLSKTSHTPPTTLYGDLNEVKKLKKTSSTEDFLRRCVCNRQRHQWCLSNVAVNDAAAKLRKATSLWGARPNNFEVFYDSIYDLIGKGKTGISYCTVYDTAIRIGWTFSPEIVPEEYVYVHQRLIKSAKHILGSKTAIADHCRIKRELFDIKEKEFMTLSTLEIEDFLCVCYDDIMKL